MLCLQGKLAPLSQQCREASIFVNIHYSPWNTSWRNPRVQKCKIISIWLLALWHWGAHAGAHTLQVILAEVFIRLLLTGADLKNQRFLNKKKKLNEAQSRKHRVQYKLVSFNGL